MGESDFKKFEGSKNNKERLFQKYLASGGEYETNKLDETKKMNILANSRNEK